MFSFGLRGSSSHVKDAPREWSPEIVIEYEQLSDGMDDYL